jgi:hypothetical protein
VISTSTLPKNTSIDVHAIRQQWRYALRVLAALALLIGLFAIANPEWSKPTFYTPLVWMERDYQLPASVKVFEGYSSYGDASPLRAWYVDVDLNDAKLKVNPVLSNHELGREAASSMAKKSGALVAINGGYFDMTSKPAKTFSLVRQNGQTLVQNISKVNRPGRSYFVTRGAFGLMNRTGKGPWGEAAWISHIGDKIYAYDEPVRNTLTVPALPPTETFPAGAREWNAVDAIGGGPVLIRKGQLVDTYENEVFFGSGFPGNSPYARAAIGITKNNHLILFATDGKQKSHSIGLTLKHLADEMQRLGCVEALNLDGGGSETLVVNGEAINHPSDGRERAITSIVAISRDVSTR